MYIFTGVLYIVLIKGQYNIPMSLGILFKSVCANLIIAVVNVMGCSVIIYTAVNIIRQGDIALVVIVLQCACGKVTELDLSFYTVRSKEFRRILPCIVNDLLKADAGDIAA